MYWRIMVHDAYSGSGLNVEFPIVHVGNGYIFGICDYSMLFVLLVLNWNFLLLHYQLISVNPCCWLYHI